MIFLTFPPSAPGAGFLSAILHFSSLRSFTALKVQLRKMACYLQGEPHYASFIAQRQPNFLKQRFSYEAFFYCVTSEINKPGTRAKWTARSGFSLKIGNAGGIKLLFDGKEIGPLGKKERS